MNILNNESFLDGLRSDVINGEIERCGYWDEVLINSKTPQDVLDKIGPNEFCFGIAWYFINYEYDELHKKQMDELIMSMPRDVGYFRNYYLLNIV